MRKFEDTLDIEFDERVKLGRQVRTQDRVCQLQEGYNPQGIDPCDFDYALQGGEF